MASQAELQLILSALDRASSQIKRVAGGVEGLGTSASRGSRGVDAFNRATHRTTAALGLLSPTAATATSQLTSLTNVSGAATLALGGLVVAGVAVVAGLKSSASAAIAFESSFAGIKKTVEATDAEFAQLEKTNRRLAVELATSVNAVNAVGQAAGSLGITGVQNIAKFEKIIIQLASAADDLDAKAAAFAFGGFASILKLSIDDIDRLTNSVVALGNKFVTTEGEITGFLTEISGAGAALGITAADLAGISAALGSVRANVEAGGSAAQRVLFAIQEAAVKGGDELRVFTALLGITGDEFRELVRANPTEAFVRFIERLRESGEDSIRVLDALGLSDVRVAREFLKLAAAGDLARRSIAEANTEFQTGSARQEEFAKRMGTTEAKLEQAKARINDLGIRVGTGLLPAIQLLGLLAEGVVATGDTIAAVVGVLIKVSGVIVGLFNPALGKAIAGTVEWSRIWAILPSPIQTSVRAIARLMDDMVNAVIGALNKSASAIDAFVLKLTKGKFSIFGGRQINFASDIAGRLPPGGSGFTTDADLLGFNPVGPNTPEMQRRKEEAFIAALAANQTSAGGAGIPGLDALLDELEGGAAAKAAKEVDILSDGIIDLAEALAHGISIEQAAVLELGKEAEEFANRLFRVAVETRKLSLLNEPGTIRARALLDLAEAEVEAGKRALELRTELAALYITLADGNASIRTGAAQLLESEVAFARTQVELRGQMVALQALIGQQGLTGKAGIFRHALEGLGEGFRDAGESVTRFLQRLSQAALSATQQAFDSLFNRPTRETSEIQLRIAELQRTRLLRLQSGATEDELKTIDDQIAALQRNIDLKEAENKILQLNAQLADKQLLTDQEQVTQAFLLIGVISQQSALVKELNDRLAFEIFAQVGATNALNEFTNALREAHAVIGRPVSSFGGTTSGVQVNVNVPAGGNLMQETLRTVNRETERALSRAGFGGNRAYSGALRP